MVRLGGFWLGLVGLMGLMGLCGWLVSGQWSCPDLSENLWFVWHCCLTVHTLGDGNAINQSQTLTTCSTVLQRFRTRFWQVSIRQLVFELFNSGLQHWEFKKKMVKKSGKILFLVLADHKGGGGASSTLLYYISLLSGLWNILMKKKLKYKYEWQRSFSWAIN